MAEMLSLSSVANDLLKLKTDLEANRERADKLEAENGRLAGIERERDEAFAARDQAVEDAETAKASAETWRQVKDRLQHQLEDTLVKLGDAEAVIEKHQKRHAAVRGDLDAQRSAGASATAQIAELNQKIERLESALIAVEPSVRVAQHLRDALDAL